MNALAEEVGFELQKCAHKLLLACGEEYNQEVMLAFELTLDAMTILISRKDKSVVYH